VKRHKSCYSRPAPENFGGTPVRDSEKVPPFFKTYRDHFVNDVLATASMLRATYVLIIGGTAFISVTVMLKKASSE